NIKKRIAQKMKREISLSEVMEDELKKSCCTFDKYPSDSTYFKVLEYCIEVEDEKLASALMSLPNKKRDIILLAYFLDMNDREIAEKLNAARRTIQYRRISSIKQLK